MPYKDPEKQAEARRKHYLSNKEIYKERVKIRKSSNVDYVRRLKEEGCCALCGEDHPATLQFHHRDPALKSRDIREMAWGGWSLESLKKEIKKCDLICANCHAKLHYNTSGLL